MDVVSTKPVSVSFVKEELLKRQEGGELSYEQSQALEHAENVSPHTQAKIDGLIKDLKKSLRK